MDLKFNTGLVISTKYQPLNDIGSCVSISKIKSYKALLNQNNLCSNSPGIEVIQLFAMLNSTEHEISTTHKKL